MRFADNRLDVTCSASGRYLLQARRALWLGVELAVRSDRELDGREHIVVRDRNHAETTLLS